MKPTLQLKIGQSLTMTPQLQQAIKLLQLSSLDLEAEIQEALDSNPMLEAEEAQPENDAASQAASQESEVNPSEPVIDFSSNTPSSSDENNLQSQTQEEATINLESGEIGQELPVDSAWEDLYQGGSMPVSSGPSEDDYDLDSRNSPEETLYDSLMWQLNLTPMSDIDQAIALSIIEAIDERGYLTTTLEEVRLGLLAQGDVINDLFRLQEEELISLGIDIDSLSEGDENEPGGGMNDISIEEAAAVLNRIQQFDPPGVGARGLGDCLLIPAKTTPRRHPLS